MTRILFQHLACTAGLMVAAGALVVSSPVDAQPIEAGVNATPTALILLDTSGSMEWRDDGGDSTYPTCVGDSIGADLGEGISRMHSAMQVLTGEVTDRYCATELRDQDPDRLDQIDPTRPQGFRHSRLCSRQGLQTDHSSDCTPTSVSAPFPSLVQEQNGLIDAFGDIIQFGFMAFDSFEEPSDCADGHFSYGPSETMLSNPGAGSGVPDPSSIFSCTSSAPGAECWNLGARRPFDPAYPDSCGGDVYQGLSVPPLDPSGTLTQQQINQQVEDEILSLVPYWSTPLGAMLADALHMYTATGADQYFTGRDGSPDYARGYTDPYQECRRKYVLLITDGEPTYDTCVRTGDTADTTPWPVGCENYPYADPEFYARALDQAGIEVYVVGFNTPSTEARTRLDSIALAGGTDSARFANSGLSLIFELGDIFSQIASGTPSRTSPANATRVSAGGRGQYRFNANFTIHPESPYWTGDVVRAARVCDDGALSSDIEETSVLDIEGAADGLDELTAADIDELKVFTASPDMHSCLGVGATSRGSLFTSSSFGGAFDPLQGANGVTEAEIAAACTVGMTPGSTALAEGACLSLTDGEVGLDINLTDATYQTQCLVEFEPDLATNPSFPRVLGADGNAQLARMLTQWARGYSLSELRPLYQGELDALLPTLQFRFDSAVGEYTSDRQSRMGAVFHSNPVVVGAPDATLEVSDGYDAFAAEVSSRDSYLYVATVDGFLRAFNASTMKQEWAFMPPSMLHRVSDTMRAQTTLTDGTPVVADVRVSRSADGTDAWRTILIFGYRGGGRGYTAMDVTDPTRPRFLWELDAELDPQLGNTYSTPGLGTIFVDSPVCPTSGSACERGIAVFGGGLAPDGLDSTSNIGHTLYVVDLLTGEVLRRFNTLVDDDGTEVPIPAAIPGDVTLFDTFTGSLATRAFVGDEDGRLLRLDLSDANPSNWSIDLFFDATDVVTTPGAILFKPSVALRASDGRAVVVFGTGDLDDLHSLGQENNIVASVVEQPEFDGSGNFVRMGGQLNWALKLEPNERVTARPRIFSRRATWATFVPDTNLCEIGGARLYQFDFLGQQNFDVNGNLVPVVGTTADSGFLSYLTEEGAAGLEVDPSATFVPFHDSTTPDPSYIPPKSIIYSLEFVQRLSCFVEEDLPDGRTWGSTQSTRLSQANDGETVLQLGISTFLDGSDSSSTGAASDVVELDQGRVPATVLPTSWSVILE